MAAQVSRRWSRSASRDQTPQRNGPEMASQDEASRAAAT
ncbi:hypothetical protein DT23_16135 [Thioclava indica]|uniref:Uncharacterized protein n=1 Tax=Thioclava indica TaxID=1353528 RepID=A0A074JM91_9RHOB|nr:hypothetical protein DT23_16135 [Thioclava indica]